MTAGAAAAWPATWSVPVAGTAQVVRFNWPKYAGAAALVAAGAGVRATAAPAALVVPLAVAAGAGAVWSATSLAATWWAYDHRAVYDRVAEGLGPVGAWATVHAGFDDATPHLAAATGRPPEAVVSLGMLEGRGAVGARPGVRSGVRASLRRATRRQAAGDAGAPGMAGMADVVEVDGSPGALSLASGSVDTVFATFSAHEVRDRAGQRALFAELRRVLRPGGRVVITEHLRGPATYLVYGPGALHFQPRRTWTTRAADAGLTLTSEDRFTPFVRRLVLAR